MGGGHHLPWGALHPRLAAVPLGDCISQGRRPPGGLYKGGQGVGQLHPKSWRLPPPATPRPPPAAAWRSPAGVLLHPPPRRCAARSSSTSPSPLLDQEGGDVVRSVCVLNAEVPCFRYLDRSDREDVRLHQPRFLTLPLSDLQGYVDALPSPSLLDDSID